VPRATDSGARHLRCRHRQGQDRGKLRPRRWNYAGGSNPSELKPDKPLHPKPCTLNHNPVYVKREQEERQTQKLMSLFLVYKSHYLKSIFDLLRKKTEHRFKARDIYFDFLDVLRYLLRFS